MNRLPCTFAYFGGEPLGVPILEELKKCDMLPDLIIANPDRPVGRKQILTAPPVKQWADENHIPVWQPENFKDRKTTEKQLSRYDLFIVVAYNHILPRYVIDMPKHHVLNVHPSLLPLLRGASPIRTAILQDMRTTGVTIMQMDEKMDHGPIVAQETCILPENNWPIAGKQLDAILSQKGGELLCNTLPSWISGDIIPQEQDHNTATYCGKLTKEMGELKLNPHALPSGDEAYALYLKICAFDGYPGTFFIHKGTRIKITNAHLANDGNLVIDQVIPEGKKEIDFKLYVDSLKQ